MDKQKQIEEMARVIIDEADECDRMHGFVSCDHCKCKDEDGWCLLGYHIAEHIYNAGYRKIPEGAVVLTEKEYKRYARIEKIIKLAKMEKANGYEVKNGKLYYFSNMLDGCEIEFKDLQEICDMANHYNEEFWGLDQRLAFWQGKVEEVRKETAEKFAERVKMAFYYEFDELIPSIMADKIDEIVKEITEGK